MVIGGDVVLCTVVGDFVLIIVLSFSFSAPLDIILSVFFLVGGDALVVVALSAFILVMCFTRISVNNVCNSFAGMCSPPLEVLLRFLTIAGSFAHCTVLFGGVRPFLSACCSIERSWFCTRDVGGVTGGSEIASIAGVVLRFKIVANFSKAPLEVFNYITGTAGDPFRSK